MAADLELVKAEEAQKALDMEMRQKEEALEQQLDIARRKLAAESQSKATATEQALKVQVRLGHHPLDTLGPAAAYVRYRACGSGDI